MFAITALSILLVAIVVMVHFEGIIFVQKFAFSGNKSAHWHLVATILSLLVLHVVEIIIFACGMYVALNVLHLGDFEGLHEHMPVDFFHISAETFTTVGYGDIYPTGPLRILASLEGITGLLLIAWSGAFSYSTVQKLLDSGSNS